MKSERDSRNIDSVITEKNDEIERGKLNIQEREIAIKKMKETHKK